MADDLRDRIAEAIDNTDVVATYPEDLAVVVSAVWDVVRPVLAERDATIARMDEFRELQRARAEQAEAAINRVREEHQRAPGRMNRCRICRTAWPCRTYRSTEPLTVDHPEETP